VPIQGPQMDVETTRFGHLDDFFALCDEAERNFGGDAKVALSGTTRAVPGLAGSAKVTSTGINASLTGTMPVNRLISLNDTRLPPAAV